MYGKAGVSKVCRHAQTAQTCARRSMQSKLFTVCWAQWRSTGHKYVPPSGRGAAHGIQLHPLPESGQWTHATQKDTEQGWSVY